MKIAMVLKDQVKQPESEVLYYQKIPRLGYFLITNSYKVKTVIEKEFQIELPYVADLGRFQGVSSKVPESEHFTTRRFKVRPPKPISQRKIENEFSKLQKMDRVIDKMATERGKVLEKIKTMLSQSGLNLKPALENDRQILCRDSSVRLHMQEAIHREFDTEMFGKLADKYPKLKECLVVSQVVSVNEESFELLLPELKPEEVRDLVQFYLTSSFRQVRLKKPECSYCGGKCYKKGPCKRCGLEPRGGTPHEKD